MKYILVDTANTFFKSRYIATRYTDDAEKVGMALHITLSSVLSVYKKYGNNANTHVVFCLEGSSWRKKVYLPYKKNRQVKQAALTESERKLDQMFWETYESFTEFLKTKTNVSVLRSSNAEADDLIARFIALHPNDEHYIVSSDGDFIQLISHNVKQYNSITNQLITIDGFYDDKGKPVKDKKTGLHKKMDDPSYFLFEKCMRGDTSDNVFSAYPGVRTKSSKKAVGLLDAYQDRVNKGFNWNNLMLQRWTDHEGIEHRVLDDYNRNVMLCDLTAQPEDIKKEIDNDILQQVNKPKSSNVGLHLMKFCSKFDLLKISEQATYYADWLNSSYNHV